METEKLAHKICAKNAQNHAKLAKMQKKIYIYKTREKTGCGHLFPSLRNRSGNNLSWSRRLKRRRERRCALIISVISVDFSGVWKSDSSVLGEIGRGIRFLLILYFYFTFFSYTSCIRRRGSQPQHYCVTQLIINESIFLSNLYRTLQNQFRVSFSFFLFHDQNLISYEGL